ncbi:MAG: PIN domain-containing protein [Nanoarchaeota archaeon]
MFLVVDINVIFSAILGIGNSSNIFKLNAQKKKYEFIAPEFLYIELGKYTSEIAQRTSYTLKEAEKALIFIERQIKFIQENIFQDKVEEARMILKGHEKDVPYLALALKFNCNIFSGDKILKSIIPDRVKTPKELLKELEQER